MPPKVNARRAALRILLLTGVLSVVAGCESRIVESAPTKVSHDPNEMKERLEIKEQTDKQIDELQAVLYKVKSFFELIRKTQNSNNSDSPYTTLDLIIDLNEDLKEVIPSSEAGSEIRKGSLSLADFFKNPKCQSVEVKMESRALSSSAKQVVYMVKPCNQEDTFVEVVTVDWENSGISFQIINSGLEKIVMSLDPESNLISKLEPAGCNTSKNSSGSLEKLICYELEVKLSGKQTAHIKSLSFQNSGDIRLQASGQIVEGQIVKADYSLTLDQDGNLNSDINKVDAN